MIVSKTIPCIHVVIIKLSNIGVREGNIYIYIERERFHKCLLKPFS